MDVSRPWTEGRVEELKRRWANGESASVIARFMGGVSRNAVLGKLFRLGLVGQGRTAKPGKIAQPVTIPKPKRKPVIRSAPKPKAVPVVLESPATVNGHPVQIMDLADRMCRFPIGDPRHDDFHFCGNRTGVGEVYCAGHKRVVFQPNSSLKDRSHKKAPTPDNAEQWRQGRRFV